MAGIRDALRAFFSPLPNTPPGPPPLERDESRALSAASFRFGSMPDSRTAAGITIDDETALKFSAVWACVRLLTNDTSTLPIGAYQRVNRVRVPIARPTWIDEPDPLDPSITRIEHFSQVVLSKLLRGESFTLCEPSVFSPTRITVISPDDVTEVKKVGGVPYYTIRGYEKPLGPDQIVHSPLLRLPGASRGMSPITAHREGIALGLAAEKQGGSFYGNGSTVSGIIKVPGDLTEPQADALRDSFQKKHAGPSKSHAVGVITGGADFQQLTMTNADAEYIATRKFQVEEIARIFGVPPHMIGSQESGAVAYASVEHRSIEYVTHTLRPILEQIEAAYARLLPVRGAFLDFNEDGLLRGDLKSRYEAYQIALQNKFAAIEEVRSKEDWTPTPEGTLLETPNNNAPQRTDPVAARAVDEAAERRHVEVLASLRSEPAPIDIHVDAPEITLPTATITVHTPEHRNEITVQAPEPTVVTVQSPDVHVENVVTAAPAEVRVDVPAPSVTVNTPDTLRIASMPDRVTRRAVTKRDAKGQIAETTDIEEDMP